MKINYDPFKRKNSGGIRAAVLGMNDGLVSNFCLVMGVSGGIADTANTNIILLAGYAALIAGSLSMAAGEYISVQSEKEINEKKIGEKKSRILNNPSTEEEKLVLIYIDKGFSTNESQKIAKKIISNPKVALQTISIEHLGLNPSELGSPWIAAISSLLAFAVGASITLIPFLFLNLFQANVLTSILSGVALLFVGGIISKSSGKNMLWGSIRMLLIGSFAASITFLMGFLIGGSI